MSTEPSWGEWIRARAGYVAIRDQKSIASLMGCSREYVSRLFAMKKPPQRMRRGLDAGLARTLQTTREMLFSGWQKESPDAAPRELLHPDQFFGQSRGEPIIRTELDELMGDVSDRLFQSELESVLEYAVKLVLARGDDRSAEFREIADRFKMFDDAVFLRKKQKCEDALLNPSSARNRHRKRKD